MMRKRIDYNAETKADRADRFAKIWWKSRADAGKSQEYVALEIGVSRKTVQNWERGASSPTFFQGTEWFRALGLNPMPYYLSYLFPDGIDGIKASDDSKTIDAALDILVHQLTPDGKRRLLYILYGNHGSSPRAVLNLVNAHLQTPIKDRIITATAITEAYELESKTDNLVRPENIQPDVNLLHKSIELAKTAVENRHNGYSVTSSELKNKIDSILSLDNMSINETHDF